MIEGVTLEERVEGLDIKETELCDRALKHLSGKLSNDKSWEDFKVFAQQYAAALEEEIYRLQVTDDNTVMMPSYRGELNHHETYDTIG